MDLERRDSCHSSGASDCGSDSGDRLDGEEEREHVCETDEPGADDGSYDSERGKEFGADGFFGDLGGGFAPLERVDCLQEAEQNHEALVLPASEAAIESA